MDSLEAFDFEKQVKAVRVEFIPERTKLANGTYTRALVDSDQTGMDRAFARHERQ